LTDVKLSAKGVTHIYTGKRNVKALDNVTIDIYENEFVTMIGPSGCGKSTFLQIVAGFIRPTEGRILCDGKEVLGPGPDRGFVFQEDAVFPWMSVRDNVEFGLLAKKVPPEERKKISDRYIRLVGLEGFEDSLPKELSGGMLKRVDLARSYAIDPAVLLMDEPFGPLDAQTRFNMQEELAQIWYKAKKTVLFVTHDIDEAIYLADRIIILTPRPGTIRAIVKVDLPHPRERIMKLSDKFLELRREVWKLMGLS